MRFFIVAILALSFISCTKKSDSVSSDTSGPAPTEVISQDLPDPSADLPAANSAPLQVQSCKKDSDCADKANCVNGLCATATAK